MKDARNEMEDAIKKLLIYIRENQIPLSPSGKERLIKNFPSLKDEIMNLDEVKDAFSVYQKPPKKD